MKATTTVNVDPGICGFTCRVSARPFGRRQVAIAIEKSECTQVLQFAELLPDLTLQDLFLPYPKNPVFKAALKAGCHLSCAVPLSVLKAAESALGLALPKDIRLSFCKNR